LKVAGGGDDPEHVYAGLDTALRQQSWRGGAERHIILLGDAPPHDDYRDDARTYASSVELANHMQVRISAIGIYAGGLPRKPPEAADESMLDPALHARASFNGKYQGLVATFRASEDVDEYGNHYDWGYWPGGQYKGLGDQPAGYWVYVAPNWYIWTRLASR
jgi:hypothetical protein